MRELTKTEIKTIRAELVLKLKTPYPAEQIAKKFGVTVGSFNQAITGRCRSRRLQDEIARIIGRWPYPWKQGVARRRAE